MKLQRFKIGEVSYFCNELQIKEAGSLEEAANKMHLAANPPQKMKSKEVKAEVQPKQEDEK